MEMLSKAEISARYGVDVAENQAAVVTMEMPDALMRKAAEIAESKNLTAATVQSAFDDITIEAYLNKMAGFHWMIFWAADRAASILYCPR